MGPKIFRQHRFGDARSMVANLEHRSRDPGPTIYEELDKLGLHLERRRMPFPAIVIDRVERSSVNYQWVSGPSLTRSRLGKTGSKQSHKFTRRFYRAATARERC